MKYKKFTDLNCKLTIRDTYRDYITTYSQDSIRSIDFFCYLLLEQLNKASKP
ncbi:hypothetical protein HanRHA438_Chr07g0319501 [Helianthus annuus]|uniref:Uncharacterized protein n=1 Tax=Helianthus annuus TaxID=4232 RepID=A0A9K3IN66_HELAN|nr:hypothetical protein HanXRQr2_Chr07g0310421 [Helianthus annuus]KAJ0551337.1 hypothetical protein HanHA300_Chr07g0256001 [Helianthus annuus]KAJ0564300.1 hypothetical protein HanHA89_Chr07g0272761 [Helianthus annuus]KAJ0909250.1 hypothetical protein HanRHA438_Chr07g0319501 [Helianthus annuus]